MATQTTVEEQLNCPVCIDRYQEPKVLPCQHTLCLKCLEGLLTNSAERSVIRCPECRAECSVPTNGVAGFKNNFGIKKILDALEHRNEIRSSTEGQRGRRGDYQQSSDAVEEDKEERRPEKLRRPGDTKEDDINEEDRDIQYAVEESFRDAKQQSQKTRNVRPGIDNRTEAANPADVMGQRRESELPHNETVNATNNENDRRGQNKCVGAVENVRKKVRSVVANIANNNTKLLSAFIIAFSVITFGRFVAGAFKLTSKCTSERSVAVYLFIKACVGVVFWGILCVWKFKGILKNVWDNRFVEVYLAVESLFSLCWLFLGTSVLFRDFYSIKNQCPDYIENWNDAFINFALLLTVLDYIGLALVLFYSGYTICDMRNSNDDARRND